MTEHLIAPHGGELTQLIVEPERASELQDGSRDWPSWDLTAGPWKSPLVPKAYSGRQ